jgi:hypothetical protein
VFQNNKTIGAFSELRYFAGIDSIPASSFLSSTISKVDVPEGVISIGANAFRECQSLSVVILPSSLRTLSASCFSRCQSLVEIRIPDGLLSVGDYCFAAVAVNPSTHKLKTITYPATVTSLGNQVHQWHTLTSFAILATTPPSIGSNFFQYGSTPYIYVPDGSVDAYKAANGWKAWANRIKPLSEFTD